MRLGYQESTEGSLGSPGPVGHQSQLPPPLHPEPRVTMTGLEWGRGKEWGRQQHPRGHGHWLYPEYPGGGMGL